MTERRYQELEVGAHNVAQLLTKDTLAFVIQMRAVDLNVDDAPPNIGLDVALKEGAQTGKKELAGLDIVRLALVTQKKHEGERVRVVFTDEQRKQLTQDQKAKLVEKARQEARENNFPVHPLTSLLEAGASVLSGKLMPFVPNCPLWAEMCARSGLVPVPIPLGEQLRAAAAKLPKGAGGRAMAGLRKRNPALAQDPMSAASIVADALSHAVDDEFTGRGSLGEHGSVDIPLAVPRPPTPMTRPAPAPSPSSAPPPAPLPEPRLKTRRYCPRTPDRDRAKRQKTEADEKDTALRGGAAVADARVPRKFLVQRHARRLDHQHDPVRLAFTVNATCVPDYDRCVDLVKRVMAYRGLGTGNAGADQSGSSSERRTRAKNVDLMNYMPIEVKRYACSFLEEQDMKFDETRPQVLEDGSVVHAFAHMDQGRNRKYRNAPSLVPPNWQPEHVRQFCNALQKHVLAPLQAASMHTAGAATTTIGTRVFGRRVREMFTAKYTLEQRLWLFFTAQALYIYMQFQLHRVMNRAAIQFPIAGLIPKDVDAFSVAQFNRLTARLGLPWLTAQMVHQIMNACLQGFQGNGIYQRAISQGGLLLRETCRDRSTPEEASEQVLARLPLKFKPMVTPDAPLSRSALHALATNMFLLPTAQILAVGLMPFFDRLGSLVVMSALDEWLAAAFNRPLAALPHGSRPYTLKSLKHHLAQAINVVTEAMDKAGAELIFRSETRKAAAEKPKNGVSAEDLALERASDMLVQAEEKEKEKEKEKPANNVKTGGPTADHDHTSATVVVVPAPDKTEEGEGVKLRPQRPPKDEPAGFTEFLQTTHLSESMKPVAPETLRPPTNYNNVSAARSLARNMVGLAQKYSRAFVLQTPKEEDTKTKTQTQTPVVFMAKSREFSTAFVLANQLFSQLRFVIFALASHSDLRQHKCTEIWSVARAAFLDACSEFVNKAVDEVSARAQRLEDEASAACPTRVAVAEMEDLELADAIRRRIWDGRIAWMWHSAFFQKKLVDRESRALLVPKRAWKVFEGLARHASTLGLFCSALEPNEQCADVSSLLGAKDERPFHDALCSALKLVMVGACDDRAFKLNVNVSGGGGGDRRVAQEELEDMFTD